MNLQSVSTTAAFLLLAGSACYADRTAAGEESTATPRAPISFDYEILGNPIVGQPIAIRLLVSSSQAEPITVEYRIIDGSSMVFPESQAMQVEVLPAADETPARQQVTVVPQREGRLYLNVSGSIETPNGTMIRAAAIPIQVGRAPREQAVNGGAPQNADGETVTSMPAEDN